MSFVARAVFVVLVGATFAAFFVAQRLKSGPPVVGVHRVVQNFSPNGDGRRDVSTFRVRVQERDDVTVTIVDAKGAPVRRLAAAQPLAATGPLRLTWDGRTDAGDTAPEGLYRVRVGLRRQGRAVTFPREIRLDTTAPEPIVERLDSEPDARGDQWIAGPLATPVELRVRNASERGPTRFRVLRTDDGAPHVVAGFETSGPGVRSATWDGRLDDGTDAPAGTYLLAVTVRDLAGNTGTTPALPPQRGAVPGVPGVSVRRVLARPPADPVRAGEAATFAVDSRGRPFKWRIRRLGGGVVRTGRRDTGGELRVRAPEGPSGVYLFEVRAGRTSADTTGVPFAVQGDEPGRILVVLPALTWFGSSAVDDGRDGLPDTLAGGAPTLWPRLLSPGLPESLPDEVAPLLVFLDREGLRYDVTTDLALAASRSALSSSRRGVLLPGPLRWVSRPLARRLRSYVSDGGMIASFGADSLRRGVEIGRTRLLRPLPPAVDDPFGARLRPLRRLDDPPVLQPVADEGDTGLLTGIDTLTGFSELEESEPSERVEVALAAVDEAAVAEAEAAGEPLPETHPVLTLSRLGDGRVIRVGLPEWGLRLQTDPQVRQLTRNIADVLRGGRPRIRF